MCKYSEGVCKDSLSYAFWPVVKSIFDNFSVSVIYEYLLGNTTKYLIIKNINESSFYPIKLLNKKMYEGSEYWLTDIPNVVAFSNENLLKNRSVTKALNIGYLTEEETENAIQKFCGDFDDELTDLQTRIVFVTVLCVFCLLIIIIYLFVFLFNFYMTYSVVNNKDCFAIYFFQGRVNEILLSRIKDIDIRLKMNTEHEYEYIEDDFFNKN